MARICQICGKGRQTGNSVSHAHNKTKKVFNPNLHYVRIGSRGSRKRIRVCTQCVKSGLITMAL